MKKYIIVLVLLLASCTKQGPQVEFICTASHQDMAAIPMTLPDGRGGNMMYMMPTLVEVCDAGFNACMENGGQVDVKLCK